MSLRNRPTSALFVASLLVHACVLVGVHLRTGSADAYAFNSLDGIEYYQLARNLAYHGSFSQSEEPPLALDSWRTPGYPVFLALVIRLVGDAPVWLIVAQQVLASLSVCLLYRIGCCFLTQRRAILLAFLFLLEPYRLYYSTWLLTTTCFVFVLILIWKTWQLAHEQQRFRWFVVTGVLCGVAILVRPLALLIPFILVMGCFARGLWQYRKGITERAGRIILGGAMLAICSGAVVSTWMARNHAQFDHFALSDQGGVVLAYFKAAEVVLWRQGRTADRYMETSLDPSQATSPHAVWDDIDRRLSIRFSGLSPETRSELNWTKLAQGNDSSLDSFVVSNALSGIGASLLMESPLSTLACCSIRCGSILAFPASLALDAPFGFERRHARYGLLALPYVLLVLAVAYRIIRGSSMWHMYLPLAMTAALLFASTPQLDPRFRVPILPFLLFVALLPKRGVTTIRV